MEALDSILDFLVGFRAIVRDPQAPSRDQLVQDLHGLVQQLAAHDQAALGALIDEMATAVRNHPFGRSSSGS